MTFLHVYFGSLGVTKFSKSELYGWQVCIVYWSLISDLKTGPGGIVWWHCGTLYGLQSPEWGWADLFLYHQVIFVEVWQWTFSILLNHSLLRWRAHFSRYIVDSHREGKGVGNADEPTKEPNKKEGGLDDALLFDIIFANNQVANKSPVKTATKEPIQAAKSPQVKAKETKKASTKTWSTTTLPKSRYENIFLSQGMKKY